MTTAEVPSPSTSGQAALVHWSLCKHTWMPRRPYPISSNCSFSRRVNQICYISVMTAVSAWVFCLWQIDKPSFSIEIVHYYYISFPCFSKSVCPHNGSLLYNVSSSLKGDSPKNNKVIHLKFIQIMNHLNSCLFKNRAVVWHCCCRDSSYFGYIFRLCASFYIPLSNHAHNRQ